MPASKRLEILSTASIGIITVLYCLGMTTEGSSANEQLSASIVSAYTTGAGGVSLRPNKTSRFVPESFQPCVISAYLVLGVGCIVGTVKDG